VSNFAFGLWGFWRLEAFGVVVVIKDFGWGERDGGN
jgi:hypothetical protein